ncbi:uncharacterized protein K452DRAFT_313068 [Aplosporella prunicola CBS 121167]|uniref:Uncharacterized protein n=1 Tax=Aplosporella prunicola CBS 121167 TaxID=1176127 RepID=A0A6A6AX60_9PEZI|nr:uncharacterized protein K452DRAFT_313068 [Aplosporella prunicola CBS 121167]KAF2136562.1 hypothetical protein K452DRAFT_313068 [Aplosporella prunicola CBS 121167]
MAGQSNTLALQATDIDSSKLCKIAETAAKSGSIELLSQCYERGFWATKIHLAAAKNHIDTTYENEKEEEAVDFLLKNDYSNHVNAASKTDNKEVIDFLYKNGYSDTVNDQLERGFTTPLITNAFSRRKKTVRYLLDQGADPNIGPLGPPCAGGPKFSKSKKMKALAVAARMSSVEINDTEMLKILLNAGAETQGTAALHIASFLGSLPSMQCLIEHGADVNEVLEKEVSCQIPLHNKRLGTSLHWAIQGGNKDAVRFLLSKHPNLELQDNEGVSVKACLEVFDTALLEKHCSG